MDASAIDHANLRIPEDGVGAAVSFYEDVLGLQTENLDLYEAGDKPFFSFRVSPVSVVHVRPSESFDAPTGTAFDHLALTFDASLDEIRATLEAADVEVDRELEPLGATGVGPAVYVTDPFGYTLELKSTAEA
jgi:catechol 2,3-dioxygenase-like lactoylglutathione lyase family enzyme